MNFEFKKKVLKNGLTILFEERNLPVVSVGIAVRAGGVNEELSEKGISHFIEHMLYKGTPSRSSKKIAMEIEKNGGELNGFTSEDVTAYWCKMPSNHLNVALEVLSDIVQNPLFDEKELEKERQVIFEEIKMRKDNPIIYSLDKLQSLLYAGTLGKSIAGDFKTMSSIKRKNLLEKFTQLYQPNNMILCVVGKADFKEIVEFAEKKFSNKKGKVPKIKSSNINKSSVEKRKGIDQANLVFAFHSPLSSNKKSYASKVLITLLAEGMSSRLFEEIREKRNLAYSIKGGAEVNRDFSYCFIYVGTSKENISEVKKLILQEFEKVSAALTKEELEEVKVQMIGNYYISQEDTQSQMVNLIISEVEGDAQSFYDFEKNIQAVKLGDVQDLARQALKSHSFFCLLPSDSK